MGNVMDESNTLRARLDAAALGLRRAIEMNAEAERLAARHLELPGVSPQLQAVRAARTPLELVLAFSAAAEAVGHAANAASQALAVLSGLANQHARYERRSGRGV